MSKLTIQILINNNDEALEKTLTSVKCLDAEVLLVAYKPYQHKELPVFKISFANDFSKLRNKATESSAYDWQMFLNPGETISEGHVDLLEALDKQEQRYKVLTINDDLIIKETRLWKKFSGTKFVNPVYETLDPSDAKLINTAIISKPVNYLISPIDILSDWKKANPTSPEPYYYLALAYLMSGNIEQFMNHANYYLFQKQKTDETILAIKYYYARICYKKGEAGKAVSLLLDCIAAKPLMAEYWCLLGDIYMVLRESARAKCFYENALDMGKHRNLQDDLPIEISKYNEYPQKMLQAIQLM